jgi:hypothetical protein
VFSRWCTFVDMFIETEQKMVACKCVIGFEDSKWFLQDNSC